MTRRFVVLELPSRGWDAYLAAIGRALRHIGIPWRVVVL